jgi:regulator of sigma E protease
LDSQLIGAWYLEWETWLAILEVVIGIGFLIFVHELGHFVVARLCGVKCEKFYLGYDIAGLKLFKFRRGETEYGIGILPLGGYVKMLGQEDNPARLREEIERAKQPAGDADSTKTPAPSAAEVESARQALFNPRSYLAKSVPRRMAIISAGVVMNLICAWIMAIVAVRYFGVKEPVAEIGQLMPGEGAWQADLRVGDEILEVGGKPVPTFQDMREAVAMGDVREGIPLVVRRPGQEAILHTEVKATQADGLPRIGIFSAFTLKLYEKKEGATRAGSPAAETDPPLLPGDEVVKLDDQPVHTHAEFRDYLRNHADKPVRVTVQRALPLEKGSRPDPPPTEIVSARVAPNPMRWLGLVMAMGPITAIQAHSPAVAAGLKPGDILRTIDGQPVADPVTLPELLRGRQGQTVKLGIETAGKKQPVVIPVTLRRDDDFDPPQDEKNPLAINSLGIAYQVLNRVSKVMPGTPAASRFRPGDIITEATIQLPDRDALRQLRKKFDQPDLTQTELNLCFDEKHQDWPLLAYALQVALPGSKVELKWEHGEESGTATLEPAAAQGWFNPERGFGFEPKLVVLKKDSVGEALCWGTKKTLDSTLLVFRIIQKMGSGEVSARLLGGPVTIFSASLQAAKEGVGNLLVFLTLLGANLAVLNFLPIPILDGGHMVFLTWEAIRGKPPDERVQLALTYCGLLLILMLMVWVLGLDFHLISRTVR